jgi:hypothetical protein
MQNTSPFLYHLAASLDIFKLWVAILMGVGYASISKVSRKTACGVILGIYFVIQLAGAGLSAL